VNGPLYAYRHARVRPRYGRVCHANDCCAKPAPMSFLQLAHERNEDTSTLDSECQWWLECYSCGYICSCEV
jgi:hypothetical protein